MRSQATFKLHDGRTVTLGHGDFIGRLWSAALVLEDPRISEAHALVSLRGDELKLLGLRGRFAVGGKPLTDVTLREGMTIALAEGLELEVASVELPDRVLGLTTSGMPPRVLPGTCALVARPEPTLAPPSHPGAVGHAWAQPDGWRVRPTGGGTLRLEDGVAFDAGGRTWRAVSIARTARSTPTLPDGGMLGPMRIVARYDSVAIHRPGEPPARLVGLSARLVSELVAFAGPVSWTVLAAELWPDGGSRKQLDMALLRLRRKLREQRVRTDLVRTDGVGVVELFLHDGDSVEDQA